ncbi:MATE family efflux transporter [Flavisphingomonas formosensis]|uniref:MATE family efflux transporter n=1 Tax=Flavisphingomonas formosensis TaxID=861534 RepID=UPI0012FCB0AD|nr:MATE family efflux transporter [Sphingomonas formosensis]
MTEARVAGRLTRRTIAAQAWPIILGQALVPLVGIVDATIIGRTGDAAALAGVALGATVINLVFWAFGFLRMGVTGLTAQAEGAGDAGEVVAILLRALALGVPIGIALLLLSPLIVPASLGLMSVPADAFAPAHAFTAMRFFGAPAALGFYAINGWLIGLGRTRLALGCQLVLNGVNIVLDLVLVGIFHLGAFGVGIGTATAEWAAMGAGLIVARQLLGPGAWRRGLADRHALFAWPAMQRLIAVNLDIMIRTLALLLLFTWFARAGARLGTVPLAANHVLMQFVGVSAFVLDGFAFTAEHRVGVAVGARSRPALLRAIRLTGEFSLIGGAAFALLFAAGGALFVDGVSSDPAVRAQAIAMLPYCALVPLIGVPAWLLDGIFIGATRGRILRNAALVATAAYLASDFLLRPLGDDGVWLALIASYIFRALSLGFCLPTLIRRVEYG